MPGESQKRRRDPILPILDAVKNPIKVVAQSGGRLKYVGKDATVVLNKAGKVITTWARNSAGTRIKP